jgi:alcohol dehydrogenase class IV
MYNIKYIKNIIEENNFKNIFLLTYYTIPKETKEKIYNLIKPSNFDNPNIKFNLEIKSINNITKLFNKKNYDLIICVGGGSVIDTGKLINIFSCNNPFKSIKRKKCKILAIPTTTGTGSECTKFAVLYQSKYKYSIEHPIIKPDFTILDPSLSLNLPQYIKAFTGMDALCQAIESYWSNNATIKSKIYSEIAITLILDSLIKSIKNPTIDSTFNMLLSANFAGKAINITKTSLPHAISYPLTLHYNIPHGHAVSLSLIKILLYNSKSTNLFVKQNINKLCPLFNCKNIEEVKNKIDNIIKEIGLQTYFPEINYKFIAKETMKYDRAKNNPRQINEKELIRILEDE